MWNEAALESAHLRLTQTGGVRDVGLAEAVRQPRVPQIAPEFVHEHGGAPGASVDCSLLPGHRQIVADAAYPGLMPGQSGGRPGSGPVATG